MIKKRPQETSYYHYHNANPKDRRTGDCVIRALSVTLGKSWDDVLDGLVAIAHHYKQSPASREVFGKYLKANERIKVNQPKHPDNTKFTGKEFCRLLDKIGMTKPVLVTIGSHHTTAFVRLNGDRYRVFDTWDCSEDKIGQVYIHNDDAERWYHAEKQIFV